MILTEEDIRTIGIIVNPATNGFGETSDSIKPVGYGLTVGDVYMPKQLDDGIRRAVQASRSGFGLTHTEEGSEIVIPPQGIFVVISAEKVRMPSNVCGFALPKTRLSEEGILILNTGIVDPLYEGFISGTLINFRKTDYVIKRGMPFLRLVFQYVGSDLTHSLDPAHHTIPGTSVAERLLPKSMIAMPKMRVPKWNLRKLSRNPPDVLAPNVSSLLSESDKTERTRYTKDKILRAQEYPSTFLNVPQTVKAVSSKLLKDERSFLTRTAALGALLFTILTGASVIAPKYFVSEEKVANEVISDLHQKDQELSSEEQSVQQLQQEVDDLKRQVVILNQNKQKR